MKSCAMLDDIRRQPDSLRRACLYQREAGAVALAIASQKITKNARRLILTGMGGSLFASIPAAYYWEQQGIAVECVETSELLHFRYAALDPQTVVVVISRSGESVEALKLLPIVAAKGAQLVGVTNVPESTLAREAPVVIDLHCANDRMVAVQSYTSTVAVLLQLAGCVIDVDGLCQSVALQVDSAIAEAPAWVSFLQSPTSRYFLARGASLASAHEAALLLHEAARVSSTPMSTAQFRHGPIEVAGPAISAVIFPQSQPLDLALAADLDRMGAHVRLCPSAALPGPQLAPILEIIPLQAAACALAQAQGIDPGDFRFASLVTSTEAGGFRA